MAMTILYNSGAQSALNTFNQNNLQANNSLLKLASGEKFIGAQGESASYAISEKMREQIRSLYQDEQNVQNGSSLVRTAERGIDQIIENLRTMKELAIDAANDSNTDEDRHTVQKEIAQRRKVINDIAIGTQYNGKILLDGRYTKQTIFIEANVGTIDEQNAYVNGVTGMFSSVKATMRKTGAMSWADGKMAYKNPANVFVPLDFSGATINGKALKLPSQMNQQGFSVMCTFGGCQSFFGFIFDSSMEIGESEVVGTDSAPVYVVGINGADTAEKISQALFEGVADATGQSGDIIKLRSSHTLTLKREGNSYSMTQDYSFYIYEGYSADYARPPFPSESNEKKVFNPLWIQHGTRAGQRTNLYINDMQSKALGIDNAEVTTRDKANAAIGIIENAISRSLDEATNMGAYLQRLEVSHANIVTMNENAQGSESTIRDADMAKEITEYTKYNLLSQSAQAMLAQANTNGALVLGLLQ